MLMDIGYFRLSAKYAAVFVQKKNVENTNKKIYQKALKNIQ